ncbi:amino acid adenylation domain protein, partial [Rubidibacter lacunae KORDI 51-2]
MDDLKTTSNQKRQYASGRFPLSSNQQMVWIDQLLNPDSPAYNFGVVTEVVEQIDIEALLEALDVVADKHDALRTSFYVEDGIPFQEFTDSIDVNTCTIDLSNERDPEDEAEKYLRLKINEPFVLHENRLWDAHLIKIDRKKHYLFLRFHHLINDSFGISLIGESLSKSYNKIVQGDSFLVTDEVDSIAEESSERYSKFLKEDLAYLTSAEFDRDREFWFDRFSDLPSPVFPNSVLRNGHSYSDNLEWELDRTTYDKCSALASSQGCSMLHFMLALIALYLTRVQALDEIVLGVPLHNRTNPRQRRTLGMFAAFLPLKIRVDRARSFTALLKRVSSDTQCCYPHQRFPVAEINRSLNLGSAGRIQLFDVGFNFVTAAIEIPFDGTLCRFQRIIPSSSLNSLDIFVFEHSLAANVSVRFDYSADTFERQDVEAMRQRIAILLDAILEDENCPIGQLPLMTVAERRQVVEEWNASAAAYPEGICLHELFEAQVAKNPSAVALVFEGEELSYGVLNGQANRLAHHLRGLGVGPDSLVGLCVERGFEMVVGLLAVLKAGGAYVPLDPGYPVECLRCMLEDSGPRVLLHDGSAVDELLKDCSDIEILNLKSVARQWVQRSAKNPARKSLTPQHLAYAIYTSGSTGQPKGVMVEHGSIVNHVLWLLDELALVADDVVLQKTPLGFDLSVWEIFVPLMCGARLVLARPEGHKDPAYLADVIRETGVTVLQFVPSMMEAFLAHRGIADACKGVRHVLSGGEALPVSLLLEISRQLPAASLHNHYGPTEATVNVTAWTFPAGFEGRSVPIGHPVANTQVYILDSRGCPVPVGVTGELYIGGVQVARGYLNRPDLTAEQFIPDPFSDVPDARLYRTGDLGRWRTDGTIEYLGRRDCQVKIRGHRIELGEIEACLRAHAVVGDAVVVAHDSGREGGTTLAAYVVTDKGGASPKDAAVANDSPNSGGVGVDVQALRDHAARHLPPWMVPSAYVLMEAFPLTASGKLDRRALPTPDGAAYVRRAYEAPAGAVEETLARNWSKLLGVEKVGRHDNFFDLGGHSLLAVQAIARLRETGLRLDVRDLFVAPELSALALTAAPAVEVEVPENMIPAGCTAIEPSMLTLVDLDP